MNIKQIVLIIALVSIPTLSCSCDYRGEFLDYTAGKVGIVKAKITKLEPKLPEGTTLCKSMEVEVIEVIKGKYSNSTITFMGDDGLQCFGHISSSQFTIGSVHLFAITSNRPMQYLGGCGESSVVIEDSLVHGLRLGAERFERYSYQLSTFLVLIDEAATRWQEEYERVTKYDISLVSKAHPDSIREKAIERLGREGETAVIPVFKSIIDDESESMALRSYVMNIGLRSMKDERAVTIAEAYLFHPYLKASAYWVLSDHRGDREYALLSEALKKDKTALADLINALSYFKIPSTARMVYENVSLEDLKTTQAVEAYTQMISSSVLPEAWDSMVELLRRDHTSLTVSREVFDYLSLNPRIENIDVILEYFATAKGKVRKQLESQSFRLPKETKESLLSLTATYEIDPDKERAFIDNIELYVHTYN